MRRALRSVLGVLLILLLDACVGSTPAQVSCESCRHGYRRVSRRFIEPTVTCIIDGKIVDCRKTPPECPECARQVQERKQD